MKGDETVFRILKSSRCGDSATRRFSGYEDLRALYEGSRSSRVFFCSLPMCVQERLGERSRWIHSAAELHRAAEQIAVQLRNKEIAEWGEQFIRPL